MEYKYGILDLTIMTIFYILTILTQFFLKYFIISNIVTIMKFFK